MATPSAKPTLSVTINDNNIIKNLSNVDADFDVAQYWEGNMTLILADSAKDIPISTVDVIKKVIIVAPPGKNATLTIQKTAGDTVLPFTNILIWQPTVAESALVNGLTLQTTEVVDTDFLVKVLG